MPEQQHYVPQFVLKRFTSGKKPALWAYDKANGRSFRTNIKNVAAERGFYDLRVGDRLLSLEPSLSRLEAAASSVVASLVNSLNLSKVNRADRFTLAAFMAVQFVRTKEHRLRFDHLTDQIAERLKADGTPEEQIQALIGDATEDDSKHHGFASVLDAHQYVAYFLNKAWCIFQAPAQHPFYISDNPIALHNQLSFEPCGNLGLAVPGIEIYFPLAPSLTLALFCPSLAAIIHDQASRLRRIEAQQPGLLCRRQTIRLR